MSCLKCGTGKYKELGSGVDGISGAGFMKEMTMNFLLKTIDWEEKEGLS